MKKKIAFYIVAFLISIGLVISVESVYAKSVDISQTSLMDYDTEGAVYSTATAINEYGMIVYDMDDIELKYQTLVAAVANSWNMALGRTVFKTYSETNTEKVNSDLVIRTTTESSSGSLGNSGRGYGLSQGVIQISGSLFSENSSVINSVDYVRTFSNIRHEMGHILGLSHDNGLVMADLYDATNNNKPEMLAAAQEMDSLLSQGILPDIPFFNKNAVLRILNSLSTLYYNVGYGKVSSTVIANAELGEAGNHIVGASFFNKTKRFDRLASIGKKAINLSTGEYKELTDLIIGYEFKSTIQVTTANGEKYYLDTNGTQNPAGPQYGTETVYAIKESDIIPGAQVDFIGNYINSKTIVSATALIDKNYNVGTVSPDGFEEGKCVGSTLLLNIIGQTVPVKAVFSTTKSCEFYLVEVNGKDYIINSNAFYDSGELPSIEIDFVGNFLTNKRIVSQNKKIKHNYIAYSIFEKLTGTNGKVATTYNNTLSSLNLLNQTVKVVAIYSSTKGGDYYRISVDNQQFVVNANAFY